MRTRKSAAVERLGEIVLRFILFFIIIFLTNWYLFAEESDGRKPGIQQKVRVAYQVTDVTVRDEDGNFVKKLGADDFVLEVDGKATPIKFVEEFSAPGAEELREYLHNVAEAKKTGAEPPIAPSPPRLIVFAFDQFNMGPRAALEAKALAKRIVNSILLPYDQVIVLQYNVFFVTLSELTSDREKIIAAIDNAGELSRNLRYLPSLIRISSRKYLKSELSSQEARKVDGSKYFNLYLASLDALASTLSVLPGRKTCFMFSEGTDVYNEVSSGQKGLNLDTPSYAEYWRRSSLQDPYYRSYVRSRSAVRGHPGYKAQVNPGELARMKEMLRGFNSANTTIYTIRRGPEKPEWYLMTVNALKNKKPDQKNWNKIIESGLNYKHLQRLGFIKVLADETNGRFFDAGLSESELLETIGQEIGNFYVLGFDVPTSEPGAFHSVTVRSKSADDQVVYRTGFYERKDFRQFTDDEKAMHMEEGFLSPGILNEFDMKTTAYQIPVGGKRQALVTFEINTDKLGSVPGDSYELEMLVNLVNRKGEIKYREHKILKSDQEKPLPGKFWLSSKTPLWDDWCTLYLGIRDNSTGRRATWNKVFEKSESGAGVPMAGNPIMLSAVREGSLSEWQMEELEEVTDTTGTTLLSGLEIPLRPRLSGRVKQGEDTLILLTVGNLPSGFDPKQASLSVNFALDPGSNEAYLLSASDLKVQLIPNFGLMVITARVPVGLAQRELGELFVAVSGIGGEQAILTGVPYRVVNFSQETAQRLLFERGNEIKHLN